MGIVHIGRAVGLAAALLSTVGGCARAEMPETLLLEGATMGTRFRVRVDDEGAALRDRELAAIVRAVLDEVDDRMSTWKQDSEVSRLNRAPAGEAVPVSGPTYEVLDAATRIGRETAGAFDVTVGPLVDAWGFGPEEVTRAPDDAEIARLRAAVGSDGLRLEPVARTVTKLREGVRVDLSAIAKGYAVDRVADALVEAGLARVMVEVGGEVTTRGLTWEERPWRIGIERPTPGATGELQRSIPLVDLSVASSGDYRNSYVLDGRTVGHTIDPRTGHPVEHRLRAVSVVTARCMEADALATALMVMGPEEGLRWATSRGLAVLFVVDEDGELVERTTPAFEAIAGGTVQ